MRDLPIAVLLERAAAFRPAGRTDVLNATKIALRMLARRALALGEEIRALDVLLDPIVEELAPELLTRPGVGCEVAGALLVAAGDNPQRLHPKRASPTSAACHPSTPHPASNNATDSTAAATAKPTAPSGASS
jgi:hypothetical protein